MTLKSDSFQTALSDRDTKIRWWKKIVNAITCQLKSKYQELDSN